jgi:voltage-gated potassium channel
LRGYQQVAKLLKAARLFRALGFLGILKKHLEKFLHTNGFIYVLYCAGALILLSSLAMGYLEQKSFGDALWWSIVTTMTVGYGDISPTTPIGRIIAIILMLFGIGMIGMLTGTITTYFTNRVQQKNETKADCSELISIAQSLSEKQLEELTAIAHTIKNLNG